MEIKKRIPDNKSRKRFEKRYGTKLKRIHLFSIYYGRVMTFVSLGSIGIAGAIAFSTYKQYQQTLSWKNNVYAVKMADAPSDILNDTEKQIKIKNKILTIDKKDVKSSKDLAKMLKLVKQVKTGKSHYMSLYKAAKNKHDIKANITSVFDDGIVVKDPKDVKRIVDEEGSKLNILYQKNQKDEFVTREAKILKKLTSDLKNITKGVNNLSQIATIDKSGTLTPASYVTPKIWFKAYGPLNNLNYGWKCLSSIHSVEHQLNETLASQSDQIDAYNNYKLDQSEKSSALNSILTSHLARSSSYSKSVSSSRRSVYESSLSSSKSASRAIKESISASKSSSRASSKAASESRESSIRQSIRQSEAIQESIRQSVAESNRRSRAASESRRQSIESKLRSSRSSSSSSKDEEDDY